MSARRVHEVTLGEFIGVVPAHPDIGVSHDEYCQYQVGDADLSKGADAENMLGEGVPRGNLDDYTIAPLKGRLKDMLALCVDGHEQRQVVGQYVAGILMVMPEHRRRGLGSLLVFAAAVANALFQGWGVPAEVLADYPDLVVVATPTGRP